MKKKLTFAAALIVALSLGGCAGDLKGGGGGGDADFPTHAIDLVLPFGSGGATDIGARAMADALSGDLKQPINSTNETGAQQVTAVGKVLNSSKDGYTLLADGAGSSSIQSLLPDLPFTWDDRTFIADVATGAHAYAVGKKSGITSLDELEKKAKDNPSGFHIAWLGGTTTSDYATLQFLDAIDVDASKVVKVPFDGSGDAMQAAAAGDVDLAVGGSSAIASLYSSGDLVPLALTAEDPNFPEIPLTADEGYDSLNLTFWVGLSGPADLPDGVVSKLTESLNKLADSGELNESFEKIGMTVEVHTGEELTEQVHEEAKTFADLKETVE